MARTVQITVPPEQTDKLIEEIQKSEGVLGLQVQRAVSLQPPGDVITVRTSNRTLRHLMHIFDKEGIGRTAGNSIALTEPVGIISSSHVKEIMRDVNEGPWEEMEYIIAKNSNMTGNAMLIMFLAGALAAIGIVTNALHIIMAGMIIAPAFEPITRVALGFVARSAAWKRGLIDTAKTYAVLFLGAALASLVMRMLGVPVPQGTASYLPAGVLLSYWVTVSPTSLLITAVASIVGAMLIVTNRTVLTAGVVIALVLVPTGTVMGIASAIGDWSLFSRALGRWSIDVVMVFLFSVVVFAWQYARVYQRNSGM